SVCRGPDGQGVCTVVNGQLLRWASLHFVGWSKRLASAFVPWSPPLLRCFLRPHYRRNIKKLIQHLYFGRRFKRSIPAAPEKCSAGVTPASSPGVPPGAPDALG